MNINRLKPLSLSQLAPLVFALIAVVLLISVLTPVARWKTNVVLNEKQATQELIHLQSSIAAMESEQASLKGSDSLQVWHARAKGEAIALVQTEISEMAQRSGISLRSTAPTSASTTLDQIIAVRIEGEASLDHLLDFFVRLESAAPVLLIETSNLRRLTKTNATNPQPIVFFQLNIAAPLQLTQETGG